MMILNVLFFHPHSLGLCMYENKKCKKCQKLKIRIKFFLKNILRKQYWRRERW